MIPKFRAWYVLAEEMIDEILMISFIRKEVVGKFSDGSTSVPLKFEDKRNGEDVILMESTGLKDKNGKEVFIGDIVKCTRGCPHEVYLEKEYGGTFIGGMPAVYLKGLNEGYAWTEAEEIIGNIYENKGLLEVSD
ncbi:YopX family protein [Streptococcus cristatus]|uniref:YopX protein n=1 Tax=Streptococcus cristatus TaxID=45634 RepID=A0A428GKV5_STRCR|nr:YopX family protein [Streptococcus cristatus]RSJ80044.1 YopX protein [Streptococcus cristatus]